MGALAEWLCDSLLPMDPAIWLLIGSVFLFIGSTRQAWFEIRTWKRKLESGIGLALDLVHEEQRHVLRQELEGLSGPRRTAKKRQINKLARAQLDHESLALLTAEERELIKTSTRGAISWGFIVLGSLAIAMDAILEVFFR